MAEYQQTRGSSEQRKGCRLRTGCGLVALAILVLAVIVVVVPITNLLNSKPLRISKETTYVTGPLLSDGEQVDYLSVIEKEVYPEDIATDANGFRLFVQRIDFASEGNPWHFKQLCEKMGLDADKLQPDLTYEEPHNFLAAYVKSEQFDDTLIDTLLGNDKSREVSAEESFDNVETAEDSATSEDSAIAKDDDQEGFGADYSDHRAIGPEPLEVLQNRITAPWTLDELPMMEQWLARNGPALDLLCEAVKKPTFHIPLARQDEHDLLMVLLLPNVQAMRSLARGLSARAHYRIGTGDIDGAIDDIMACKRLGRHMGRGALLITWLVGIAIEGIADSIGIAGQREHSPKKEHLLRLLRELEDLPPKAPLEEKLQFERYMSLDALQKMAHGDDSIGALAGMSPTTARTIGMLGFDWNIAAQRLNMHYDKLVDRGIAPPEPSFNGMIILSRTERSKMLADVFAALFIPGLDAAHEAAHRQQCVEQMKRITLAMLVYECDHAVLPPAYSVDAEGNPLHSWRVLLLPYLGKAELFGKIRLDEPWDSEHNQQLHGEEVALFRCPSDSTAKHGETTYSVVVGPEAPFEAGQGKRLADFGPNNQHMILLAERSEAVCWMEPAKEIPQSLAETGINVRVPPNAATKSITTCIASPHPGGANFGFRDGSVRFLSHTIDVAEIRKGIRGAGTIDH